LVHLVLCMSNQEAGVSLKNNKIKILNLIANTSKGKINLQAALDVKHLYQLIKSYFEEELLVDTDKLTDARLQRVLNKKAKNVSSLNKLTFDDDVRVIELAVLIGVLETLHRLGGLSKDYAFLPAWQLPKQQSIMKAFSSKESWDGFIVGKPKNRAGAWIQIPIELKSLMTQPQKSIGANPNDQLNERLKKFKKHFQHEGSINCVLVMPYTSEKKLGIDLKAATDDLRASVSSKASSFVCFLTFPYDQGGRLAMSILFALVSQSPSFMSADNKDKWMCQVNFGKQK